MGSLENSSDRDYARSVEGSILSGVRIVDFTWLLAGPACTRLLAGLGADVVKIESAERIDFARRLPPIVDEQGVKDSAFFREANLGKRSIVLDLKSHQGKGVALDLIRQSDVLVENFRPGVMSKLGLSYEAMHDVNPELLYASISGLGNSGPLTNVRLYGELVEALSGLLSSTGYGDGEFVLTAIGYPDTVAGTVAAFAILLHLYAGAKGARIDVSMLEAMLPMLPFSVAAWVANAEVIGPRGNWSDIMFPHDVYKCRDERWLAIEVWTEADWRNVLEACGVEASSDLWSAEGEVDRVRLADEIERVITSWAGGLSSLQAEADLRARGVPCSRVNTMSDLLTDPNLVDRAFWEKVSFGGRERLHGGVPLRVDGGRPRFARRSPRPGEHTFEVLR
jgi:crotonobetainyl-CoA:carnitine CoA-transferase CaiB-like acyl-CoA transferase